jgi:putative transposase
VWDITWLPGPVAGTYHDLYLRLDLFSRKVVGWEVCAEEPSAWAARVLRQASLSEGRGRQPLVLHSDNGRPMKGGRLMATRHKLGISASFNRPGVSDDNAQAEAFFRTMKFRPGYPVKGFPTLEQARQWVVKFVRWDNGEHRHSAIPFVPPRCDTAARTAASSRHATGFINRPGPPDRPVGPAPRETGRGPRSTG